MANETLNNIDKLETDLWEAADNLRANSKLTSSDHVWQRSAGREHRAA